jgi:D-cysteine desulfhydrase
VQRRDVLASLLLAACGAHVPERPSQQAVASPAKAASEPPERELELFRHFPRLRAALPRAELARLPTPVESAPELARELGLGALWIKRDDRAADPYGGNKVRKLELYLGQALAEKRRAVLTFGGVGSNHALATAVHARRLGLEVILALLPQHRSD